MTKVAIIGPGAVGTTVAAYLSQSTRIELSVCARTPFTELVLDGPHGRIRHIPTSVTRSHARIVDWVLVATKAYDSANVAAEWLPLVAGDHTRVAILQNGVEHVERFAPHFDAARLVPTVVDLPSDRLAAGHARLRRAGSIRVPDTENGRACCALFDGLGLEVRTIEDFTTATWKKLCTNCAGAVSAMAMSGDAVARYSWAADLALSLAAECANVGRAEGAVLEAGLESEIVAMLAQPGQGINSILADRLAGRPMEVDARNGVVVRKGALHHIPTPANASVVQALQT
jgi:2-dehydropantoate 2-reductase